MINKSNPPEKSFFRGIAVMRFYQYDRSKNGY